MAEVALSEIFYAQIAKIHQKDIDFGAKIIQLNDWLTKLFISLSDKENLPLSTMFARISFVCHKWEISRAMQWHIFKLRHLSRDVQRDVYSPSAQDYASSLKTVSLAGATLCGVTVPEDIRQWLPTDETEAEIEAQTSEAVSNFQKVRVYIVGLDRAKRLLIAKLADRPTETIYIRYDVAGENSNFNSTIRIIAEDFQFSVTVNLLDGYINKEGEYVPKVFVLEPDYLIDVSAIANCFQGNTGIEQLYLMRKFAAATTSQHMMLGNVANFFLDELLGDAQADFRATFIKSFQLNPLTFALFEDKTITEMYQKSKGHFASLQRLIKEYMPQNGIKKEDCYLEPSFYSETYGIQGRLDVWQYSEGSPTATIIELKSGKPFHANRHGISNDHYTQTILYDLLVRSVFKSKLSPTKYIFYSALPSENLKYAPSLRQQELEAIKLRNQIIGIERRLATLDRRPLDQLGILDHLRPEMIAGLNGFNASDVELFANTLAKASDLELRYFRAFVSFTAREHQLARTGAETNEANNGTASLWLSDMKDKMLNFQLLGELKIIDNKAAEAEQSVTFARPQTEMAQLANFREGDIIVLYPRFTEEDNALTHQIFKGSIYALTQETVTVKLNFRQFNGALFEQDVLWYLEHDMMDKSYTSQYQALYKLLCSKQEKRDMLLTISPPANTNPTDEQKLLVANRLKSQNPLMSEEQVFILTKAIVSKDYFLLIGPPGTGKTKYMLAELVRYLLLHSEENILLLAYTNRAVDEICDAISSFAGESYLRIGSRSVSAGSSHSQSFYVHTKNASNRKEIMQIIEKHRIFVSTIASITSQSAILSLKRFDTAVIDEASQVLEPALVGLLPSFRRFVLIGDDKQLPAVVLQGKNASRIDDEELLKIGLTNRRNSLFERFLKRAEAEQWHWAYDMLSHQGRMHDDIRRFPSEHFYAGRLKLLEQDVVANRWQVAPLAYKLPRRASELAKLLAQKRMLFFPTPVDYNKNNKVNRHEAQVVSEIVAAFHAIYAANDMEILPHSVGVITPYRAQIAQIRYELSQAKQGYETLCTIDTVERYQGGARDVIIISLCLNNLQQLETLVSLDDTETVDRKLNVALTRARQHLIIVGNEELLRQDVRYRALLDFIRTGK
jgi:DNA replication ATP-dependent helicase Dna2